jgi:hypothetical protein
MAVRRRVLSPDAVMDTQGYGPVPYVSDAAFLEAVLAAAQTVALAGGVLSVVVDRHPTDYESEMVTTAAMVEWRDRTDAKPQPEPTAATKPPVARTDDEERLIAEEAAKLDEPLSEDEEAAEAEEMDARRAEEIAIDGLDPATLEEEDVSSIDPAELVRS